MWIFESAEEVERVVRSGALPETEVFDAKAALPESKKNADLAVDVAAMSTDGGVLLYGVGEDADGRTTVHCPIELAGQRERELKRAFAVVTEALLAEAERADAALADRLAGPLRELAS